ncbi:hypothetical protein AURDEDRAFT_178308 [Auricularia subglabra TFB-10046 SS5]|uniref:Uncharacterized protein n=1 Tax=Auricularia subglabra (strain TFB-10046 / SS5) TaxID=717982 RepID=J0WLF7_AURST|nr:hypothetical protein AURDEDRAFT_178308 [Auricularia subglabra TFB-10046 SS5]
MSHIVCERAQHKFASAELARALAVINWNVAFPRGVLFENAASLDDKERTALLRVLKGEWQETSARSGSESFVAARMAVHALAVDLNLELGVCLAFEVELHALEASKLSAQPPSDDPNAMVVDSGLETARHEKVVQLEAATMSRSARFMLFVAAAMHLHAELSPRAPTASTPAGAPAPPPAAASELTVDLPPMPDVPVSALTALLDGEFPDLELRGTKRRREDDDDDDARDQPPAKKARAPRMLTNFELAKYEDLELKISRYADTHGALLKAMKLMHVDISAALSLQQQILRTIRCQFPFLLNMPLAISRVLPEMKEVAARVAATAKGKVNAEGAEYARRLISHCPVLPQENDPAWLVEEAEQLSI